MKGYKRDILLFPTMKSLDKQHPKTPVFMRVSRVAMSRIYAIYAKRCRKLCRAKTIAYFLMFAGNLMMRLPAFCFIDRQIIEGMI